MAKDRRPSDHGVHPITGVDQDLFRAFQSGDPQEVYNFYRVTGWDADRLQALQDRERYPTNIPQEVLDRIPSMLEQVQGDPKAAEEFTGSLSVRMARTGSTMDMRQLGDAVRAAQGVADAETLVRQQRFDEMNPVYRGIRALELGREQGRATVLDTLKNLPQRALEAGYGGLATTLGADPELPFTLPLQQSLFESGEQLAQREENLPGAQDPDDFLQAVTAGSRSVTQAAPAMLIPGVGLMGMAASVGLQNLPQRVYALEQQGLPRGLALKLAIKQIGMESLITLAFGRTGMEGQLLNAFSRGGMQSLKQAATNLGVAPAVEMLEETLQDEFTAAMEDEAFGRRGLTESFLDRLTTLDRDDLLRGIAVGAGTGPTTLASSAIQMARQGQEDTTARETFAQIQARAQQILAEEENVAPAEAMTRAREEVLAGEQAAPTPQAEAQPQEDVEEDTAEPQPVEQEAPVAQPQEALSEPGEVMVDKPVGPKGKTGTEELIGDAQIAAELDTIERAIQENDQIPENARVTRGRYGIQVSIPAEDGTTNTAIFRPTATREMAELMERARPEDVWQSAQTTGGILRNPNNQPSERNTVSLEEWAGVTPEARTQLLQKNRLVAEGRMAFVQMEQGDVVAARPEALISLAQGKVTNAIDEEINHRIVSGNLRDNETAIMAAALDRANSVGLLDGGTTNYAGMDATARVNDAGFIEQSYQLYKALTGDQAAKNFNRLAGPERSSGNLLQRIIRRLANLFGFYGKATREFDVAPARDLVGRIGSGRTAQQAQRTDVGARPAAEEPVTRRRQEAIAREAAPIVREAERERQQTQRESEREEAKAEQRARREQSEQRRKRREQQAEQRRAARSRAEGEKREARTKAEQTQDRIDTQLDEVADMVDVIDARIDEASVDIADLRAAAAAATAEGETDQAKALRAAAARVNAHKVAMQKQRRSIARRRRDIRGGKIASDKALRELRGRVDRALARTLDRIAGDSLRGDLSGAALKAARKRFAAVKRAGATRATRATQAARAEAAQDPDAPANEPAPAPRREPTPSKPSRTEVASTLYDRSREIAAEMDQAAPENEQQARETIELVAGKMRPPARRRRGGEWDAWTEDTIPTALKMRLLNKKRGVGRSSLIQPDQLPQLLREANVGFHGETVDDAWRFLMAQHEQAAQPRKPLTRAESREIAADLLANNDNPTQEQIDDAIRERLETEEDRLAQDQEADAAEQADTEQEPGADVEEGPFQPPPGDDGTGPAPFALGRQKPLYAAPGATEQFESEAPDVGRVVENLALRTLTTVARRLQSQVDATLRGPDQDVLDAQVGSPQAAAELVKRNAKHVSAFAKRLERKVLAGVTPTADEHLALRVFMDAQAQMMQDAARSTGDIAALVNRSKLFRRLATLDRGIGSALGARLAHLQDRVDTPEGRRQRFFSTLAAPPDKVMRRVERLHERANAEEAAGRSTEAQKLRRQAQKLLDSGSEGQALRVARALKSLGLDITSEEDLNELFVLDPDDPNFGFFNLMRDVYVAKEGWKLGELMHALAMQNLFSPATFGANLTGNTLMTAALGFERGFEGLVNDAVRLFGKDVKGVSTRDTASVARAAMHGLVPALADAARAAAIGFSPTDLRMGRLQKQSILEQLGANAPVFFGGGKKSRVLSAALTPLSRAITFIDEFFKSLVNRAAITGIALDTARQEGLAMGTPAFDARVRALAANPTPQIQSRALTIADEATFKEKLDATSWSGMIEKWVGHLRNIEFLGETPFAFRPGVIIVLFLSAIVRIGRQAGRRSVGLQEIALLKDMWTSYRDTGSMLDAMRGGKAQALRNVTGYMLALAATALVGDDEDEYLIQGSPGVTGYFGPEQQLDLIRGRGETIAGIDISRLEPLSTALVHAANVRDAFFGTEFEEGRSAGDRAARLAGKTFSMFLGNRYFDGMRDILIPATFGDFDRAGTQAGKLLSRMTTFMGGTRRQIERDLFGEGAKRGDTDEPSIGPLGGRRDNPDAGLLTFIAGTLGLRRKGELDTEKAAYIDAWAQLQKVAAQADPEMRDKFLSRANRTYKDALTQQDITLTEQERTRLLDIIGRETFATLKGLGAPDKLAAVDQPHVAMVYMEIVADARAEIIKLAKLRVSAERLAKDQSAE